MYIYIYIVKNHGKKSAISSLRFCLGDVSTRLLAIQANALKIPEDLEGEIPNFLIHQRLLHHVLLFVLLFPFRRLSYPPFNSIPTEFIVLYCIYKYIIYTIYCIIYIYLYVVLHPV